MRNLIAAALLTASPAYAELDPCLIGIWNADTNDMAHVMKVVMEAESVITTGGTMQMQIFEDQVISLFAEDLQFQVTMAGTPAVQIKLNGDSQGEFETAGISFWTGNLDSDITAEATTMGMTMPFDASGLTGRATGIYGCTETGLSFEPDGPLNSIPRSWTRLE